MSDPAPDRPSLFQPDPDAGPPEPGQLYRTAWVLYLLLAVAGVVWIGLREGSVGLGLFLDPAGWWLDLAAGAGAGLALLGLWELARRVVPVARELEGRLAEVLGSIDASEAVALALLSGFAEELFFRGAVQGAFSTHGWLWSSLLFALLHSGPGRAFRFWGLFAFAAGLAFAGLMAWRGNLLAPITAHAVVNAINLHRMAREAAEPTPEESGSPRG